MSQKNAIDENAKLRSQMEAMLRQAEQSGLDLTSVDDDSYSNMFQSLALLGVSIASLELGLIYTAILCQIIAMFVFIQLAQLQRNSIKEEKIMIQSKLVQWYLYFCVQFAVVPETWLSLSILQQSGLAPEAGSLMYLLCYQYHGLAAFCLLVLGMIGFVTSLQEGFYTYQFKQLLWTLFSATLSSLSCSGLLFAASKCRMWFIYALGCTAIQSAFSQMVKSASGTQILSIKPGMTLESYIAGFLGSFLVFTLTVTYLEDIKWLMLVPSKVNYKLMDENALIMAYGPLFEKSLQTIEWTKKFGLEPLQFIASQFQMHLFFVTLFIAFVAPFGGSILSAIKLAMRKSRLGNTTATLYKSSVFDCLHCVIFTGIFMLCYLNLLVYKQEDASTVLDKVASLSLEAQKELYEWLKADLMTQMQQN